MVFNTEVLFQMLDNLFSNVLQLNDLFDEEIGYMPATRVRRILSEMICERIIFGVAILQMLEMANTTDGILTAHFQVDFWTAISSAILICILGGLAGLAPAWRAMSIKPVDAMRDE